MSIASVTANIFLPKAGRRKESLSGVEARQPEHFTEYPWVFYAIITSCFLWAVLAVLFGIRAFVVLPILAVSIAWGAKRPDRLLLALIWALPIGLIEGIAGLKVIDLAAVSVVGAAIGSAALGDRLLAGWRPACYLLLALVAELLIATPFALEPAIAKGQNVRVLVGVMLVCVCIRIGENTRTTFQILQSFVIVGGGICIHGALTARQLETVYSASLVSNRAQGMFSQPNDFGSFSAIVFLVALALSVEERRTWARRLDLGLGACAIYALLISLSRGGIILAVTGSFAIFVMIPKVRKHMMRFAAVASVVIVLMGAGVGPSQGQVIASRIGSIFTGNDNPLDERPAAWAAAFRVVNERPIVGIGPLGFGLYSATQPGVSATETFPGTDRPAGLDHAHNTLLTIAAEAGVPAALTVFVFTAMTAWGVWANRRRSRDPRQIAVTAAVAASLTGLIFQGLFDFSLRNPVIATLLYILTGFALAVSPHRRLTPTARGTVLPQMTS